MTIKNDLINDLDFGSQVFFSPFSGTSKLSHNSIKFTIINHFEVGLIIIIKDASVSSVKTSLSILT